MTVTESLNKLFVSHVCITCMYKCKHKILALYLFDLIPFIQNVVVQNKGEINGNFLGAVFDVTTRMKL